MSRALALSVACLILASSTDAQERSFQGWRPQDPSWLGTLREHVDARSHGWPSEHAALAVEQGLESALTELVFGSRSVDEQVEGLLAEDFEGSSVYAPETGTSFEQAPFRIVTRGSSETLDRAGFARSIEGWRAAYTASIASATPRMRVRAVGVQRERDGSFTVDLVVRAASFGSESALQYIGHWTTRWRVSPRKEIVALAIRAVEVTEAAGPPRLFDEVTSSVFGGYARFAHELALGTDRPGRIDRLADANMLGMHGIAVGDVDGDGLDDVYVAQPGGQPNLLFLHAEDGTTTEVGREAGVAFLDQTLGVLIADLDGDGRRDIVSALGSVVVISWNLGDGRFSKPKSLPSDGGHSFYSLNAADADGDGDLDLYGCRYMTGIFLAEGTAGQVPAPIHDAKNGAPNVYWSQIGPGPGAKRSSRRFRDLTDRVGLGTNNTQFSLAALWEDFDGDGDPDLYVANDFGRNNLFLNEDGRFVDVAAKNGALDRGTGMGLTCADVDLDGDRDVLISNMHSYAGLRISNQRAFPLPAAREHFRYLARGSTLLLNDGQAHFEDVTVGAHIAPGGWSWGSKFIDLDNDGYEDVYVPNGFISGRTRDDLESFFWRAVVAITPLTPPATTSYVYGWQALREFVMREGTSWNGHERNYVYLNASGPTGVRFFDVSELSGADFEDDTRVAATLDWDGDGALDLLLASRTGPRIRLLRNAVPDSGRFLRLQLVGAGLRTDAVGAQVELELATGSQRARRLSQTVYAGDGYLGCSSTRLHFGLGDADKIDRLTIRWPDGTREVHADVPANASLRTVQGSGKLEPTRSRTPVDLGPHTPLAPPPDAPRLIQLAAPLPLSPLSLPTTDGDLPVSSLAGTVTVFLIDRFSTGNGSLDDLAALVRHAQQQHEGGLRLVPVTFAEDDHEVPDRLGLLGLERALVAGRGAQSIFRMLALEVLGPFDSLPLPVAFVVDKQGLLRSVHCAPAATDLIADVRRIAALPDTTGTESETGDDYLGGFWLRRPQRDLARIAQVLRKGGQHAMADAYERLTEERKR